MLVDVQEYLQPIIAKRLKRERRKLGLTQLGISSTESAVSNIESEVSFITPLFLERYHEATFLPKEYLLFGNEEDIKNLVEWILFRYFSLIVFKDLESNKNLYKNTFYYSVLNDGYDDLKLQAAVIQVAEFFGEYNVKRSVFNNRQDLYLDYSFNFLYIDEHTTDNLITFQKLWNEYQKLKTKDGKIDKQPRYMPYFIDYFYFFSEIWTRLGSEFVNSFKRNFLENFNYKKFKFDTINDMLKRWQRKLSIDMNDIVSEKMNNDKVLQKGLAIRSLIKTLNNPILEITNDLAYILNYENVDVFKSTESFLMELLECYESSNGNKSAVIKKICKAVDIAESKLDVKRFNDASILLDITLKTIEQNISLNDFLLIE
ncbi:helix-turn-helix domain-containing protein [Streptococcus gallolyticus]|uniref:helix-turn-helix domain-containing protein n=1 Tax=Streptococcus gallolyticus TaxID=315405 RepID=UPI00088049DA|nr:helix-turn-helix transcriptional regulator [Streptococcus gallolyticus]SDJ83562.1 hypothetical protein SAMN04487842_0817 [Streptococcus gallolyticus]SDL33582.1 hypothetical protein SAMN04487841_0820 [Streptococcus gallolyticus]